MTRDKVEKIRSLLNRMENIETSIREFQRMKAEINSIEAHNFKLIIQYQTPPSNIQQKMLADTMIMAGEMHQSSDLDNLHKLFVVEIIQKLIDKEQDRLDKLQFMLDAMTI